MQLERDIAISQRNDLARDIMAKNRALRASKWTLENLHNQEDQAWKGTRDRALRNIAVALPGG